MKNTVRSIRHATVSNSARSPDRDGERVEAISRDKRSGTATIASPRTGGHVEQQTRRDEATDRPAPTRPATRERRRQKRPRVAKRSEIEIEPEPFAVERERRAGIVCAGKNGGTESAPRAAASLDAGRGPSARTRQERARAPTALFSSFSLGRAARFP